jgi:hypothetical protein
LSDQRPGLIPQNTTRRPGARTSGTELTSGGFELGFGLSCIEPQLKQAPDVLAAQPVFEAQPARLQLDYLHGFLMVAVTTGIALGFVQNPQPHDLTVNCTPDGGGSRETLRLLDLARRARSDVR